jgi:hypothetical protein
MSMLTIVCHRQSHNLSLSLRGSRIPTSKMSDRSDLPGAVLGGQGAGLVLGGLFRHKYNVTSLVLYSPILMTNCSPQLTEEFNRWGIASDSSPLIS